MRPARSGGDWLLEVLALLTLLFMILMPVVHGPRLPARIATHFNAAGEPDGWGSRSTIWYLPFVGLAVYLLLSAIPRFPRLLNVPRGVDRNSPEVLRNVQSLLIVMKLVEVAIFAYLERAVIHGAMGRSPNLGTWFAPVSLLAVAIPVGYYLIKLRKYRPTS